MTRKFGAARLCATLMGAVIIAGLASPSADAQTNRRRVVATDRTERITVIDERGRARTRITVAPRSFLDAGNTPIPGESKALDYALPLAWSPLDAALGPGKDFRRRPLLDPWDFPGTPKQW